MISTNKEIIFVILILNCFVVLVKGNCGNSQITCKDGTSKYECSVHGQNTDAIQQKMYECSQGTKVSLAIELILGGEGATLNLSLPSNIEALFVYNYFDTACHVETSLINSNIVGISFSGNEVFINHNDFLTYFPNLQDFYAQNLGSDLMPFFTNNVHVTSIEVYESTITEGNGVIDRSIIGRLEKLEVFYWEYGNLTKLMPDSFNETNMLTHLSFVGNKINELNDCTFLGLLNLEQLDLSDNDITKVGKYAFIGLESLQIIRLSNNPSFLLSTLTVAKNITRIYIKNYNPALLNPGIFQQFPKLSLINMRGISVDCTCEMEWISILKNEYSIRISLDSSSCSGNPSLQVDDPSLYVNCSNPSYQCFNHSIVCPGNNTWYRADTEDGCNCTYPPERAFYNDSSFVCSDIDECEDSSITCQGNCTNTIGSYTCDCRDGFINLNETFCNDVNECEVDNGGCEQNCNNIIGSFDCSCFDGFNKSTTNSSDCEFIDIAPVNPQILNFGETEFILVIFGVVVFVLLVLLVLIFIVLLFCFFTKRWSYSPKQILGYNPTIAELDKKKANESTVIQNPLSDSVVYSPEPLKEAKVSPQV